VVSAAEGTPAGALAVWRAAEAPAVTVDRLPWPQLEAVTAAAAPLRPAAETSSVAADVLAAVTGSRRVLTCTPLPPDHPLTGVGALSARIAMFLLERPDHSLAGPLRALAATLAELVSAASPVAAWCTDVLSRYGACPDGTPEAVLVVPRRAWTLAVYGWLHEEELTCVDVAAPGRLRAAAGTHAVAVVCGHPATAYSSAFRAPEVAVREHGWLLTAPPADTVCLALPADAPPLDTERLWLLPAPAHPNLPLSDAGPVRPSAPEALEWELPAGTIARRAVPRPQVTPEEAVRAVEVHLASGHAVFFHGDTGPRPHLVAVDETGVVALTTAALSAVMPGAVLAVRAGGAAHEAIWVRAEQWLTERRGWSAERIQEVRDCAMRLKFEVLGALSDRGPDELRAQLARHLPDRYARVLLHNLPDPLYIAPRHRATFDVLVRAVGATDLAGRFEELATVRTAHQQAGELIRRDLVALLTDRGWTAEVEEDGWAALHAGPLGTLLVSAVTARADTPVPVPRTWLGVPIDDRGRRATTFATPTDT
jgi:hypothetical protein